MRIGSGRAAACVGAAVAFLGVATAAPPAGRPAITGIDGVGLYTTRPDDAARFWTRIVGTRPAPGPAPRRFAVNGRQSVALVPVAARRRDMLAYVAYRTTDVAAMRSYLVLSGFRDATPIARDGDGDGARWFAVRDPDGVEVRFVERATGSAPAPAGALGDRIIHAGHLVRDRARADRFYRRLLGFRPYWFGGMRAGTVDWVSQQVPDGRDWYEYMLVAPGAPPPDAAALGGMNHLSLGTASVRAAMARLAAAGTKVPRSAAPLLGRDGKWQANLHDPDGTRVELMDLAPSRAPCCSPFTAPNP